MSADPAWFLFRVLPENASEARNAFEKAAQQARIPEKTREFLRNRALDPDLNPDNWSDLCLAYDLFYPEAFEAIVSNIFSNQVSFIPKEARDEAHLEAVITNRIGAAMMLWCGLGFERANRLPGAFGNMFVSPEAVASTLHQVEEIFGEVEPKTFIERADAILIGTATGTDVAPQLLTILSSSLRSVLREGYGLLALNYGYIGALPYSESEDHYSEPEDDYLR
ncbi:MAG: hypothetical protein KME42_13710 [Tildeniella nuda ZEHNDER 1965/U140]|jgi:hypothetical protein|nr:hypothetical protein [Tildeniella nuda ZEHNDER 1965/U140]